MRLNSAIAVARWLHGRTQGPLLCTSGGEGRRTAMELSKSPKSAHLPPREGTIDGCKHTIAD
jgi:hypothetical protein